MISIFLSGACPIKSFVDGSSGILLPAVARVHDGTQRVGSVGDTTAEPRAFLHRLGVVTVVFGIIVTMLCTPAAMSATMILPM